MSRTPDEIISFCRENDVRFVKLSFCDVFWRQKNLSVMSGELSRVFRNGIVFDGTAVRGFDDGVCCDLLLHPEPDTFAILPWRPEKSKVARMFCNVTTLNGTPHLCDTRASLKAAAEKASRLGINVSVRSGLCFATVPSDRAGAMDVSPKDGGEDIRRKICLYLEQVGIKIGSSYHAAQRGQNVIELIFLPPLEAADSVMTFSACMGASAAENGCLAKLIHDKSTLTVKVSSSDGISCRKITLLLSQNSNPYTLLALAVEELLIQKA